MQNKNLVVWNFNHPSNPTKQVDLIINFDLKDGRTKSIKTDLGIIKVLSKQDLILMKKASGRPQDLEDVKALEEL